MDIASVRKISGGGGMGSFELNANLPRAYWVRHRLHEHLGRDKEAAADKAHALLLGYKPDPSIPLE
jgi:hypothetical protein